MRGDIPGDIGNTNTETLWPVQNKVFHKKILRIMSVFSDFYDVQSLYYRQRLLADKTAWGSACVC